MFLLPARRPAGASSGGRIIRRARHPAGASFGEAVRRTAEDPY